MVLARAHRTDILDWRRPEVGGEPCQTGQGVCVMSSGVLELDLDLIEELRLRRWARENYVPPENRQRTWHPVVHE